MAGAAAKLDGAAEAIREVWGSGGSPCALFPQHGIGLLAGASGVGKTALYASWLRILLEGGDLLGRPTRMKRGTMVGVICADRGLANNMHWFEREEIAKHPQVVFYSIVDDAAFPAEKLRMPGQHPKLFARCLDQMALPADSFLVVDPFSLFCGSKLNDYSATAAALIPLQRILRERRLTCLGVHHTSKMKADPKQAYIRPQDQILGSMALAGYTDTQFYIKGPEETNQPHWLVGFVSHTEVARRYLMTRDGEGRFHLGSGEAVQRAEIKGNTLLGVLRLVTPALEGTATMMILQAAGNLGIGRRQTFDALAKLVLAGAVVKDGHGRYRRVVEPPGEVPERMELGEE